MRLLLIDEVTKIRISEVVRFASTNWYRPGYSETVPGEDSRHVLMLNSFRCVFSFTREFNREIYRHLTVSVRGGKYPNPIAFYVIADLFGFTGWDGRSTEHPLDWKLDLDPEDRCVVVAQMVT